ncbi:RagB/SusD family nutrient uptake outer membrane protein [Pedobacter frigidisoli]|uniref:RagB/SusD family nutrient uptake outer membrane protein n=1 Tax=Pedobacter frigidisoli TaxID=2530455 RepID=UPI00292EBE42|nr:RagB/SusD family nutrient uptake outer membrane protein [Pedobacter frigidisoli]
MKSINIFLCLLIILSAIGCKKFIELPAPQTLIDSNTVFNDVKAATAAEVGMYLTLANQTPYQMSRYTGSYVDELTNLDGGDFTRNCYVNSLNANLNDNLWRNYFKVISQANQIISGLNNSTGITGQVKNQLLGEAMFTRAFAYFNLTNIYGDLPLVINTDYRTNLQISKSTQAQVYQQIVTDLLNAENLLGNDYVGSNSSASSSDRIRPNKWAAKAMLARVYLYQKNYVNAAAKATEIINNNTTYALVSDLEQVFLKNSGSINTEAIWQLDLQQQTYYYSQGYNYYPQFGIGSFGDSWSSTISPQLLASFENGDQRKQKWIYNYDNFGTTLSIPYKYKNARFGAIPEHNETVIRLAEILLIRAEARNETNNPAGAKEDLDVIRLRAGLSAYSGALSKGDINSAIAQERQVELFCEWGHRFFDLKRTAVINTVMTNVSPIKGGTWASFKQLWPIPFENIKLNRNITQNTGYN